MKISCYGLNGGYPINIGEQKVSSSLYNGRSVLGSHIRSDVSVGAAARVVKRRAGAMERAARVFDADMAAAFQPGASVVRPAPYELVVLAEATRFFLTSEGRLERTSPATPRSHTKCAMYSVRIGPGSQTSDLLYQIIRKMYGELNLGSQGLNSLTVDMFNHPGPSFIGRAKSQAVVNWDSLCPFDLTWPWAFNLESDLFGVKLGAVPGEQPLRDLLTEDTPVLTALFTVDMVFLLMGAACFVHTARPRGDFSHDYDNPSWLKDRLMIV